MRYFLSTFFCLLLGLALVESAYASHVRAGEITAVRDRSAANRNTLTYIFTFTMYRDMCGSCVQAGPEELFFGDGTSSGRLEPVSKDTIGNRTEKVTYIYTHTYSAPGIYIIHISVENRNDKVLNMFDSLNTPFHVKTTLFINQSVGINNTPILLNAPIDLARVGQRFIHNPDAFDIDGDVLRYRLTTPQLGYNRNVNGYRHPHLVQPPGRSETRGPATFSIDSLTGDLVWDSPVLQGLYNVAFVIEEWRNGIKIGEVVRDMQIIVRDNPNNRPNLEIPNDTCIVAGSFLQGVATATDPDKNRIRLTASSGLFQDNFPAPKPTFTVPALQMSPVTGLFEWQSECVHVRKEPYQVVFKAEDLPGTGDDSPNKLVDIKVWQITVVGPRPTGLRATPQGANMQLSWDAYTCSNAAEMIIYRRVGCTDIDTSVCNTGLVAATGYVEIGRVPIGTTTFIDTNNGLGLDPGTNYSYRIVAGFAPPQGGESLASAEACTALSLDMPFITNVDVQATSSTQGEILVKWIQPLELDTKVNPGPYRYDLYRGNGFQGGALQRIRTVTLNSFSQATAGDTTYLDKSLNTADSVYHYVLFFYTGAGLQDSTQSASSVRLTATPVVNAIELSWQAQVPWSNANTTHKVYRESRAAKGSFELIATVEVGAESSFRFTDTGNGIVLDEDSLYCYYVETSGSYSTSKIPSPLLNKSQVICASPLDTLKPCPPLLAIDVLDCASFVADKGNCNLSSFSNKLTWEPAAISASCDEDVVGYRLYYKRYMEDEDYELIASLPATAREYVHSGLRSFAGCYYLTAVDEDGQESDPSNEVCKDNCPYYELPNVITVNGDGKNDELRPFECPLFVEKVEISIHNRWGRSVFESEDNIFINWDGRLLVTEVSSEGQVSTGVYYYLAKVRFARLSRKDELVQIKGWVHVLR
ncbi:gliding motility-associated C-terminal domain-containing protein [Rhodocytophaga rosea]|uniref:Gliding motility-associated C-terminal domain-containing protein n=1 Tax=Rhodocytophaga rosea TaxID=2704465 RepID=A0A6C0GET5_9BACT|nr:gliding motility-associated C-terminal domain-containing protein [Rhodocytophaga rosea]QHT66519.1 gliding motility-associated C-terminal domain-containing protein [Rhodocytophaga rosea]